MGNWILTEPANQMHMTDQEPFQPRMPSSPSILVWRRMDLGKETLILPQVTVPFTGQSNRHSLP